MATNPTLLTQPIAANGAKNVIPNTTSTAGAMSQDQGFPAETALPLGAGGVAPSREDFNGAFNLLSGIVFMAQKGFVFNFDNMQDYYVGCVVIDTTDGQKYECIVDAPAGTGEPHETPANWKIAAIDISNKANRDLSNLTQDGEDHFLEQDFTIIYPNGGTEANPASVALNTRYVESNPFAGYHVMCIAEVFYNDKWGVTGFYNAAGNDAWGVKANEYDGNIVVQTAVRGVMTNSNVTGNPFGNNNLSPTSAPCRVKVWKIGKVASA